MPSKGDSSPLPSSPLQTYLSPPTKLKCPNPNCGKDLYYYPPTKINNVKSALVLLCASCSHIFPPPSLTVEPPTEALSDLSIVITHYETLGVEKTATADEISRAYRKKSLHCHPDRTRGREKEWEQLTKAYDILGDKRKRHWYDVELEKGTGTDIPEDPTTQGKIRSPVVWANGSENGSGKVFPRHFWRRKIL